MTNDRIRTVEDMMRVAYPDGGEKITISEITQKLFGKADDPVLSSTSGWTSPVYGKPAFNWLNMKSDVWKLFPKKKWTSKSGWRVIYADESATAGRSETASIVDSDKPDILTMKAKPKFMQSRWDVSEHANFYSQIDDSLDANELRAYYMLQHPKAIDKFMKTSYDAYASGDTRGTYVIESIDRLVGSASEATYIYHDATSANIYNFAYRRQATTYDAYVDLDTGDNDRPLTLTMIDNLVENALTYGADRNRLIFLTGYDTYMDWNSLLESKQMFLSKDKIGANISLNGVEVLGDQAGGFMLASYDGIPIFTANDMPKDGKSHVYLFDLDNMEIWLALPTVYMETSRDDYLLVDSMTTKHMFLTGAELIMKNPKTQGKIINLE